MKYEEMKLEKVEIKAKSRKLKGMFTIRPDGRFLLTQNEDPEAHQKFWEEMEKEPCNEY